MTPLVKKELEKIWNFHRGHKNGVMAVSEAKKIVDNLIKKQDKAVRELKEELYEIFGYEDGGSYGMIESTIERHFGEGITK